MALPAPVVTPSDEERKEAQRAIWHIRADLSETMTLCGKPIRQYKIGGRREDRPGLADVCVVCESLKWGA